MATIDIAINETTSDLDFQANGDFYLNEGRRAIAQRLRLRFGVFLGEWFLDETFGVAYREEVLVRNPDLSVIGALFRQTILGTPGVTGILEFDLTLDGVLRTLTVDFIATTEEGDVSMVSGPSPIQPWMFVLMYQAAGPIYGL
jgi:hypothetical protein